MTYENCLKYAQEAKDAGDEKMFLFWKERAAKKAPKELPKPEPVKEVLEETKPKFSKRGK